MEDNNSLLNHKKKSTIQSKSVKIAGNNDFSSSFKPREPKKETTKSVKKSSPKSTQRVDVNTINLFKMLYYFIPDIQSEKSSKTFNDILRDFSKSYIENVLTDRQKATIKEMCEDRGIELK